MQSLLKKVLYKWIEENRKTSGEILSKAPEVEDKSLITRKGLGKKEACHEESPLASGISSIVASG